MSQAPKGRHLLEVDDLRVEFRTEEGVLKAVDGVTYTLDPGKVVAILGESGSGKTVHARAMLRILDSPPAFVTGGSVLLEGEELLELNERDMTAVRGERIAMLFQDPHVALDPVFSVGSQMEELLRTRLGLSRKAAKEASGELLRRVGIASPNERLGSYPHMLSGGIAQRVMIALAIALDPQILLADEPTSSLDVTVQAQVLELLGSIIHETQMGMVLITHNLAVAVSLADEIAVMYAGRIIEIGPARQVYDRPVHPYTAALLRSIPSLHRRDERMAAIEGAPPNLLHLPQGCPFHPRCAFAVDRCRVEIPALLDVDAGRKAACHRAGEIEP